MQGKKNFFNALRQAIDRLEQDDDCFACMVVGLVGNPAEPETAILIKHPFDSDAECAQVLNTISVKVALNIEQVGDHTANAIAAERTKMN